MNQLMGKGKNMIYRLHSCLESKYRVMEYVLVEVLGGIQHKSNNYMFNG